MAGAAGQPLTVEAGRSTAPPRPAPASTRCTSMPTRRRAVRCSSARRTYGQSRPDIGSGSRCAFHPRRASAWSRRRRCRSAPYTIVVYGHSTVDRHVQQHGRRRRHADRPRAPFGAVDTPADSITVSGEVAVTGWALDDVRRRERRHLPLAGAGEGRTDLRRPRRLHPRRAARRPGALPERRRTTTTPAGASWC